MRAPCWGERTREKEGDREKHSETANTLREKYCLMRAEYQLGFFALAPTKIEQIKHSGTDSECYSVTIAGFSSIGEPLGWLACWQAMVWPPWQ